MTDEEYFEGEGKEMEVDEDGVDNFNDDAVEEVVLLLLFRHVNDICLSYL